MKLCLGKINRRTALGLAILPGVSGCAALIAPGTHLAPLPPSPPGPYLMGAGDRITLRIYDQPQLSGQYSVDDSGYIDMPLLGLVQAAGRSTNQLAEQIRATLQVQKLILQPSVAVEISSYRPFYILGEVNQPGQYPYRPGMTVLTAISIAGGFTYRAVESYAGITRDAGSPQDVSPENGSQAMQYRASTSALAQPGDVITVFERRF